jgi:predicted lysophospholipase L1 biosynthesis ABC-type transport system permease subunit
MARRYWPDGDALGDRITIAKGMGPTQEQRARQIVGIVADVRDDALNTDPQPTMYVPWGQVPDSPRTNAMESPSLAWIVRTRGEPTALRPAIREALRLASGGLPVSTPRTMEEIMARSTARYDFNMLLLAVFAGAAVLLAAIGIYGLMAYSVAQRTQEIGVRLTLGASTGQVRNMILRQGMSLALAGIVLGIAAALGLARFVAGFLFGVTSRDPMVFVVAPLMLLAIALVGVWLPASRAARIAPAMALRLE